MSKPRMPADPFVRRLLWITGAVLAVMWSSALLDRLDSGWIARAGAAGRAVQPRGALAADETDTIELSPQQLRDYRMFTGPLAPPPRTVHEFNTRLEAQASFLEAGGSPDERLAAMLARELQIR